MLDVNFDKYISCLSWQVLNKGPSINFVHIFFFWPPSTPFCMLYAMEMYRRLDPPLPLRAYVINGRPLRIKEGWLTEPVVFFIGHYIPFKTMSFLLNSVLCFPHTYDMVKEEKGE